MMIFPRRQEYIHDLLFTDKYGYTVVAEFGSPPPFLNTTVETPTRESLFYLPELLRVGIIPRTKQYGDEQDIGPEQYTIILNRTGPCG